MQAVVERRVELHSARLVVDVESCGDGLVARGRPVGKEVIAEANHSRGGVMQPRVTPTEADELLVQPVHRPAVRRETLGSRREGGTDLIIAAWPLFLDTAERLLVAGVDAGRAADCEQDDKREGKVPIVIQLGRDPGDVVIADEGEGPEALLEVVVPAQRPSCTAR